MKEYKIASIAGDGIGKVVPEGIKILKVAKQHQFKLTIEEYDLACAITTKNMEKCYR